MHLPASCTLWNSASSRFVSVCFFVIYQKTVCIAKQLNRHYFVNGIFFTLPKNILFSLLFANYALIDLNRMLQTSRSYTKKTIFFLQWSNATASTYEPMINFPSNRTNVMLINEYWCEITSTASQLLHIELLAVYLSFPTQMIIWFSTFLFKWIIDYVCAVQYMKWIWSGFRVSLRRRKNINSPVAVHVRVFVLQKWKILREFKFYIFSIYEYSLHILYQIGGWLRQCIASTNTARPEECAEKHCDNLLISSDSLYCDGCCYLLAPVQTIFAPDWIFSCMEVNMRHHPDFTIELFCTFRQRNCVSKYEKCPNQSRNQILSQVSLWYELRIVLDFDRWTVQQKQYWDCDW